METTIIMGMECTHNEATESQCESWWSKYNAPLDVRVTHHRDSLYSLHVGYPVSYCVDGIRATPAVIVWDQPSIEAAERAWLEVASIEAPRLCAFVVGMLTAKRDSMAAEDEDGKAA